MTVFNIPTKEVLEEINTLRLEGRSITSLSKERGYHPQTVTNHLRRYGYIKEKRLPRRVAEIKDIDINMVLVKDRRRELRDNFMNGFLKVRKEYAEGQKVDVSYSTKLNKPRSGSIHTGAIKGRAIVKKMYPDFMLLEKQGKEGIVRECINFNAILSGDVNVTVAGG